jgi:hypothetical protein
MAYTPSVRKTKSAPNNFAGQAADANRVAMNYANAIQSQDATASPVVSPAANVSAVGATLTVPQAAVRFTIQSTVAIQVGEDSTFVQGFSVPANTICTFDCAQQAFIYLKASNATNVTNFFFNIV